MSPNPSLWPIHILPKACFGTHAYHGKRHCNTSSSSLPLFMPISKGMPFMDSRAKRVHNTRIRIACGDADIIGSQVEVKG